MNQAVKRILILGAGVMQLPSLRAARELGLESIVADGSKTAPGKDVADHFIQIDLKDSAALRTFARQEKDTKGLDAVFTAGTDFSATVALIAADLGLPGIPHEVALNATIKSRMRARFQEMGVPSPRFFSTGSVEGLDSGMSGMDFPLVVKPVDSMGARGCMRVDSMNQMRAALSEALAHSRSGQAIIEEFIDGPEFSIDALVHAGEIHICGIADRHIFFPPYFVEMGHTLPSSFPDDAIEEVVRVFRLGVRALGICTGAAKGDIKLGRDGKARVGEIAARLSGGFMSGWTFPYSSSIDLHKAAIRLALGMDPGNLLPTSRNYCAERAWISIPGRLKEVKGIEEASALATVRDVFPRAAVGDGLHFPRNNVEKCGNVIAVSPSRDEAVAAASQAAAMIRLILEPASQATKAFLSSFGSAFPPDAFSPLPPLLLQALEDLPLDGQESQSSSGPPYIHPLPPECSLLELRDWQGRSFAQAFQMVCQETGARLHSCPEALGRGFWKAFLRGSYQGGIFYIQDRNLGGQGQ